MNRAFVRSPRLALSGQAVAPRAATTGRSQHWYDAGMMRVTATLLLTIAMQCLVSGCAHERTASVRLDAARPVDKVFTRFAIAADHPIASEAGAEILRKGGNAVDAAVATSFCLSVVRPYSCGLGGGGFMLIFIPARDGREERCVAINYRETCPAAVGPDYYASRGPASSSEYGATSVAVPGTVAGLCHALQHYGTLDLATVLAPAIRAADEGVRADADMVDAADELRDTLDHHPELRAMAEPIWHNLCRGGELKVGDVVRQPAQARALKLIAAHGPEAFYRGSIAAAIHSAIRSQDGPMTATDLREYAVREVEPLRGDFRDYEVYSMPPPSSGGVAMQQVLGIIERQNQLLAMSPNSAAYLHLLAEAFKHAFADRAEWLADPEFVDVPTDYLLDFQYLNELAARTSPDHTLDPFSYGSIVSSENPAPPPGDSGTSHFCVVDSTGMAVACTETINLNYGSLLTVPGFGIALNDEMDDFTTRPGEPNAFGLRQSMKNSPEGGKRPLSSMAPTIIVKDGRAVLIAGASGGPRIITGTTQCILNCLMFDMSPQASVDAPRIHHQWLPNVLRFERPWADAEVIEDLQRRGHETGEIEIVGEVQMILIAPDGIRAVCDARKGGVPAGE
jgi:gamma-glutamyltranspeptidase/glutathione hydrolase